MPPFLYRPLSTPASTRIFELEYATHFDAPLRGKLKEIELDHPSNCFEALSYVWGHELDAYTLSCNGQSLLISRNCEVALRNLRSLHFKNQTRKRVSRPLWVDSICIDQQNTSERNQQVQRMGTIFRSAARVLIWLGESHDSTTTGLAMAYLRTLAASYFLPLSGTIITVLKYKWFPRDSARISVNEAIEELCCRPWFQRVWTMQELLLSGHNLVICGKHAMSWADFAAGTDLFLSLHEKHAAGTPFSPLLDRFWYWEVMRDRSKRPERVERLIASILLASRSQRCSDERDKVFAILPILGELQFQVLTPDYTRPVQEIYEEVTFQYIVKYRCLHLLEQFPRPSRKSQFGSPMATRSLPTWVVDLRTETSHRELEYIPPFAPVSEVDVGLLCPRVPGLLPLRGTELGSIIAVCSETRLNANRLSKSLRSATILDWIYTLRRWCQFVSERPRLWQRKNNITMLAVLLLERYTFCMSQVSRQNIRAFPTYCERLSSFWDMSVTGALLEIDVVSRLEVFLRGLAGQDLRSILKSMDRYPYVQEFTKHMSKLLREQEVFLMNSSQGALVGLGPSNAHKHDRVVMCAGARVPFILRPLGNNYAFLGPAEVYSYSSLDPAPSDIFTLA